MSKGSEAIVDNDPTRIGQKVNLVGFTPTRLLRLDLYQDEEGR
jgi:hypothetical protein